MKRLALLFMSLLAMSSTLGALSGDFYAQQDPRNCVSPYCGGYLLLDSSTEDPCRLFRFDHYVTGIYFVRGSELVPYSPRCNQLLTGSTAPDPSYPDLEIFILDEEPSTLGMRCRTDADCSTGLRCCYPCGIPDCENVCMEPWRDGQCPLFP